VPSTAPTRGLALEEDEMVVHKYSETPGWLVEDDRLDAEMP
jgi:hypothetical protein